MADGQVLSLGRHQLMWQSTPHLPHGWECGYFFDTTTGTLFCGDLFTQPGVGHAPLVDARHPRAERGIPPADGLLRAFARHRQAHRQAREPRARAPRLHARQRLARRRRRDAAQLGCISGAALKRDAERRGLGWLPSPRLDFATASLRTPG